jgi:hypothetical protein
MQIPVKRTFLKSDKECHVINVRSVHWMIKSRRMRWAGHVARIEEKRNAYRILVGMPEGKRPLG